MPKDDNKLPGRMQEDIATAVAFAEDDNSTLISSLVELDTFDQPFDDIISRCLDYRDKYNKPPGKGHLDDIFSHVIDDKNHKQHTLYNRLIEAMLRQADKLNTTYVLDELSEFTKVRKLRNGISKAVERYQKGGANVTDDLQAIFRECLKIKAKNLDYGFTLADDNAFNFLDRNDNDYCKLGIPELDNLGCIPTKQELLVFMAARNRGKSMFLNHAGKFAATQGWVVFHYTLENSDDQTSQRYMQSLFSGVKREGDYHYTEFVKEKDDRTSLQKTTFKPSFYLSDPNKTVVHLRKEVKTHKHKLQNLRIRRFPTGKLSFAELEKDLDEIQLVHKQKPDIILIDSPQLMRYDRKNEYASLGELYIQLRGLAIERNVAIVCTHQGNRKAERASTVYGDQIAGSIDVIGVADNVITYSQTPSEEEHGLARLYLQKVRNDLARAVVCITQHYPSAQFCLGSRFMDKHLRDKVAAYTGHERTDEDVGTGVEEYEPEKRRL